MDNIVPVQAVVHPQAKINPNQAVQNISFFNQDGTPHEIGPGETPTGDDILLTGLTAGTATPVAATDSVNEAIAKLQAQLDALP